MSASEMHACFALRSPLPKTLRKGSEFRPLPGSRVHFVELMHPTEDFCIQSRSFQAVIGIGTCY